MNSKQATSNFVKETAILGGVLGVVALIVYGLALWGDSVSQEVSGLRNDVNRIARETTTIQTNYAKVQRYSDLHKEILKAEKDVGLSIDRQTLGRKFNEFNERFHLSGLRLTMASIENIQDTQYQRETHVIESGKVSVSVAAPADTYIYDFMAAIRNEMPGSARITSMSVKRRNALTNEMLKKLADQGTYSLVEGEFKFDWSGIRPVKVKDANMEGAGM